MPRLSYGYGWDYLHLHDEIIRSIDSPVNGDEVTYFYVKGHGWIPETPLSLQLAKQRQKAKPQNFGWIPEQFGSWADELREYERRTYSEIFQEYNRQFQQQYFVHDDDPTPNQTWYTPARSAPQHEHQENDDRADAMLRAYTFYQGSGVTVERNEAENRHERASREYRQALGRLRRR